MVRTWTVLARSTCRTASEGDLYKPAAQQGQGADLKWLGDDYTKYTGVVYKSKARSTDHQALIDMLNALNNGGDLENHLDVDGILGYFAVWTLLANFDSYQGSMLPELLSVRREWSLYHHRLAPEYVLRRLRRGQPRADDPGSRLTSRPWGHCPTGP